MTTDAWTDRQTHTQTSLLYIYIERERERGREIGLVNSCQGKVAGFLFCKSYYIGGYIYLDIVILVNKQFHAYILTAPSLNIVNICTKDN